MTALRSVSYGGGVQSTAPSSKGTPLLTGADLRRDVGIVREARAMSAVIALDLSLTSTGWAYRVDDDDGTREHGTLRTGHLRGVHRLITIRDRIAGLFGDDADLVLIEDLPHGARNNAAGALGELHGVIKVMLHEECGVAAVLVPPATVKVIATGRGNADKMAVLSAAVQRLGYTGSSGDEADALWLLEFGLQHLGESDVTLPATHLRALDKVSWGTVPARQLHLPQEADAVHRAGEVELRVGPRRDPRGAVMTPDARRIAAKQARLDGPDPFGRRCGLAWSDGWGDHHCHAARGHAGMCRCVCDVEHTGTTSYRFGAVLPHDDDHQGRLAADVDGAEERADIRRDETREAPQ